MKIIEIGTGYTSIPAKIGAATEIVVEKLSGAFAQLGYSVEVMDVYDVNRKKANLLINEIKIPLMPSFTDERLGILHKFRRVTYSIGLALKLRKNLRKSNEKLYLHFHNQYNLFFFYLLVPRCLRKKAYIAYTVHSYVWHGDWQDIKKTVKRKYFQECICIKKADGVFVLNQNTLKTIIEHLNTAPDKVHLIDNGVDTNTYYPLSDKFKHEIKRKHHLDNKKIYIQVGSVCDRKNQLDSIKLLLPFMKKDENVVFCYAGGVISDEYQQKITDYAKSENIADRVIYCGEIEPGHLLNEFYNLGEAMIFPSKAEGFSLVILEAMSAGVPVIVSEQLNFPVSDKCITCKDENDFEKCVIEGILDSKRREEISREARREIEENYSWNSIAETYRTVWNQ